MVDVGRTAAQRGLANGWMLHEIVLLIHHRLCATDEQNRIPVVQLPHLVWGQQLFATMSSGELKKVANIKEFIFVATILIIFQPDSYCLTCTIREYEL
mgnify:CR=1 FL=1